MKLPPSSPTGVLLFIVDDDADTRSNLRDILELDGYEIAEASSAQELFALSHWDRVSLILLDRKLPDSSPEVLLSQIKQRAPQASVFIVTGYADVESAVTALRQGAADYIIKPVNPDALRAGILRELTHQRSERQLQALFENTLAGILLFDAEQLIVDANTAVCTMLRMERSVLVNQPLQSLVAEAEATGERNAELVFLRQAVGECRMIRSDKTLIDVEYQTTVNFFPGLSAISLRDITERKLSEQRALQAERLAAIGETMTALVHESRNALQRSFACLEMLACEVEDRPSALDLVQRTQRAQTQLRNLYEEVREWAAPINLRLDYVSLASVWREAWHQVSQTQPEKAVKLLEQVDGPTDCRIDVPRMNQVFRNIFENALEVSPNPGTIELRCSADMDDGQKLLRVSIADRGPGMSEDQLARIFEPFFTTKTKGTGLGMAIAKRIVTAHQGQIAATSPEGACIEITLPASIA